jgi:hypothetical protein
MTNVCFGAGYDTTSEHETCKYVKVLCSRRYETYDFRLLRVSFSSAAPIRAYSEATCMVFNALWIIEAPGQAHLQVVLHNQTSPAQLVGGCVVHAHISYHDLFAYLKYVWNLPGRKFWTLLLIASDCWTFQGRMEQEYTRPVVVDGNT